MRSMIAALALIMGLALPAWAQSASDVKTLAEQGNAEAQFVLGSMYRDGQGVEKDLAETIKWWKMAAELGNVDAQFALEGCNPKSGVADRTRHEYSIARSGAGACERCSGRDLAEGRDGDGHRPWCRHRVATG